MSGISLTGPTPFPSPPLLQSLSLAQVAGVVAVVLGLSGTRALSNQCSQRGNSVATITGDWLGRIPSPWVSGAWGGGRHPLQTSVGGEDFISLLLICEIERP